MSIKACVFCKHCDIDQGFVGSEMTGTTPPSATCNKNKWDYCGIEDIGSRDIFLIAQRCEHFDLRDDLKGLKP